MDHGEAISFLEAFSRENPRAAVDLTERVRQVLMEIDRTGTYRHTPEELTWGAKVAWRNSARCIGRLYWNSLQIRDRRRVHTPAEVAAECVEHLRSAWRGGRIRPTITIFPADAPDGPLVRIWNDQLIRYAGYLTPDGHRIGDGQYTRFTSLVGALGWRGAGTPFDVLPLLIETRQGVSLHPVPRDAVAEVRLSHPEFPWFADLGLRWHAVPAISNMRLEIGGVSYSAAPFNGWYMETEIGARNLVDPHRYNVLPLLGRMMGLDMSAERTLWRDRALIELNRAVLHSFDEQGVAITDHHTESQRFLQHLRKEEAAGRVCPADWSWIVPPVSGGLTPVYHRYYDQADLRPAFFLDPEARMRGAGEWPLPPLARPESPGGFPGAPMAAGGAFAHGVAANGARPAPGCPMAH
ncbi:nitric oxide synthase oxygenase [Allostreptomyces psammosilenae]|uniref:Nitric oxide synthase oxygenase n=1 Tax=Allostreptomyces psammosilenae TaxID=1892865 RepID=A0A853A8J5_9ACTN|nr:nitric oxide synthase oxygenase [Allostreptomyces psammosilenae]NYI06961.1 nitric-oxide synthase [Allostreptomyces psammosilenae]